MANTVIQLKKSSTPSSAPASLANGEIALNYADGVIYYKAANGTIASISAAGGSSFGTVNAGGTLVVADQSNDILDVRSGDNITITGDAINDRLTIAANLTPANNWSNTKLSNATGTLAGSLSTTGTITSNGYIYITPPDNGNEGGEIQLSGAGNFTSWSIDGYQNNYRVFARSGTTVSNVQFFHATGGSIRMAVNKTDPAYEVDVVGDVNITGTYRVNGTPIAAGSSDLTPANNWANTINTAVQTSFAAVNNYTISVGTAANSYAGAMANSANIYGMTYTNTSTTGANNFAGVLANNTNNWANTINTAVQTSFAAVNNYTVSVGTAGNNYTVSVGAAANSFAGAMANSANIYGMSYTNTSTTGANNFAGVLSNNTNNWANTINTATITRDTAGNNYTISVGASGNNWANTINTAIQTQFPAVNNFVVSAITSNTAGANGWANNINTWVQSTFVKLTASSQTITGDLAITGNLSLLGNATSISSNNLIVGDSLIYLAANNYSGTDILDIGFVANYANGTGANVHTGLLRDATTKQYYLFNGLDIEIQANNTAFVPYANGVVNAALNADLITSNLTLGGANAILTIVNNAAGANGWANNINTAVYTSFPAVNNYTVSVGTAANSYAGAMANSVNIAHYTYANATGTGANNFAGVLANNSNNWANTKLANTSGVSFVGDLFLPSGKIGIGQSQATSNLDVNGVNTAYTGAISSSIFTVRSNTSQALMTGIYSTGTAATSYAWMQSALMPIAGSTLVLQPGGGSVAIGTNTTSFLLDVAGTVNISSANLTVAGMNVSYAIISGNTYAGVMANSANIYGMTYTNTSTTGANNWANTKLSNTSGVSFAGNFYVPSGNVGVGTTSPQQKLEVNGNLAVDAFVENSITINSNYTITTGRNAFSAGPITVNTGITVTVPSGSTWTVS